MNKLIQTLVDQKLMIQTIESFTGGLLANYFIKHAGASKWFKQGLVLYQLEAKAQFLGLSMDAIRKIDPVSKALVKKVLSKALSTSPNSIIIMTTGNAGPSIQGKHPVGDFYVGISDGKHELLRLGHAKGSRVHVQQAGLKMAIQMLEDFISTYYSVSPK
jgi:PncC family amidohydrolase